MVRGSGVAQLLLGQEILFQQLVLGGGITCLDAIAVARSTLVAQLAELVIECMPELLDGAIEG